MNRWNKWKIANSVINILIAIVYAFACAYPFLEANWSEVSFDLQINPTYLNGLLTASSMLFGFSSLLVVREKPVEKFLWVILIVPLTLIIFSGNRISGVALGTANSVEALLVLTSSFNANLISTALIVGWKTARWFPGSKET